MTMVSNLELSYRYDKYIEAIEEANLIAYEGESVDRPTKRAIQQEDFNIDIHNVSVNDSHELLLEYDDRRPGIRYLDPDTITWLSVKLTKVLEVAICIDHEEFWWFTHDFSRVHAERYDIFPEALIDNLELMTRLVLKSPTTGFLPEQRRAEEILSHAKTLASYLGYPTLEGFVKVACRRDIRLNGAIREGRKIRQLTQPGRREYKHHDDGDGICSNVGMLLWHLETEVARPRHRNLLKNMRQTVGEIFDHPPEKVYGLLYELRNNSLHGHTKAPREYGVLLNYICLTIWITLLP